MNLFLNYIKKKVRNFGLKTISLYLFNIIHSMIEPVYIFLMSYLEFIQIFPLLINLIVIISPFVLRLKDNLFFSFKWINQYKVLYQMPSPILVSLEG